MKPCPNDSSPLRSVGHGSTSVHTCDQCHGFWLPLAELKADSAAGHLPRPGKVRVSIARRRGPRSCADCGATLLARRIEGVEVDICRHCRALWLDAGELELIVQRHSPETGPQRSRRPNLHLLERSADATELVAAILEHSPGLLDGGTDAATAVAEFVFEVVAGVFS